MAINTNPPSMSQRMDELERRVRDLEWNLAKAKQSDVSVMTKVRASEIWPAETEATK